MEEDILLVPAGGKEALDKLVLQARGCNPAVETDSDWKVITAIINLWIHMFPHKALAFKKSQKETQQNLYNEYAAHEEKGGAVGRQLTTIPREIDLLIMRLFPKQHTQDMKFIKQFWKRYPMFRIAKKI